MRTLVFIFSLLFLPLLSNTLSAQPTVKSFKVVEGEGFGTYKLATGGDTLSAWIEHASLSDAPNRNRARRADMVVWCYPQRHSHPNHIFPEAEGKIYSVRVGDMMTFYTNRGLEKLPGSKAELIKKRSL